MRVLQQFQHKSLIVIILCSSFIGKTLWARPVQSLSQSGFFATPQGVQWRENRNFYFGASAVLPMSQTDLIVGGYGFSIGNYYRINPKLSIVPELGYIHAIGKKYTPQLRKLPVEETFLQVGPCYNISENISMSLSVGAHITFRHYFLNESIAETFRDMTWQLSYRSPNQEERRFSVGLLFSHFYAERKGFNYFGLKAQYFL
jgi:hypothetical protein